MPPAGQSRVAVVVEPDPSCGTARTGDRGLVLVRFCSECEDVFSEGREVAIPA